MGMLKQKSPALRMRALTTNENEPLGLQIAPMNESVYDYEMYFVMCTHNTFIA